MRTVDELVLIINKDREKFYKLKEWKVTRVTRLELDHYECQRCNGNWSEPGRAIKYSKPKKARYVHHILPLKDYPIYCIDIENLVSLCFNCHEEVEGRIFTGRNKKPQLNEERW